MPARSSSLPGTSIPRDIAIPGNIEAGRLPFLLGLAPDEGCLAAALLRRRWSLTPPFHPCPLRGGMFLWPDLAGCPAPGVTRHRALWSADFPRHPARECRGCPTSLRHFDHTVNPGGRQSSRRFARRGVNAVKLTLAPRRPLQPWVFGIKLMQRRLPFAEN